MKLGKYFITCQRHVQNDDWIYLTPAIEYRHKYWYIWEISITWLRKGITICITNI